MWNISYQSIRHFLLFHNRQNHVISLEITTSSLLFFSLYPRNAFSRLGFSELHTMDIVDQIIFCCKELSGHYRMLSSIPGLYPLDNSSIHLIHLWIVTTKMSLDSPTHPPQIQNHTWLGTAGLISYFFAILSWQKHHQNPICLNSWQAELLYLEFVNEFSFSGICPGKGRQYTPEMESVSALSPESPQPMGF